MESDLKSALLQAGNGREDPAGDAVFRTEDAALSSRACYLACVDVKRILREKIYEKMFKLGASYSEQVSSSEVVQVVAEGVEQLETYFGKYLPQLFYSLIAPLTLFIILCRVSLKASVILPLRLLGSFFPI